MAENTRNQDSPRAKSPIQILRERQGTNLRDRLERNRQQAANRLRIAVALKDGPKTVPEIAQITGLPPSEVLWHLMAMKKYGKLVEADQRDDYMEYALSGKSETRETAP